MRKRPLTAAFVARVKTPGRYGDGGLGGLGLYLRVRRMKSGRVSRSWGQRIRVGGKPTNLGLGSYRTCWTAGARSCRPGPRISLASVETRRPSRSAEALAHHPLPVMSQPTLWGHASRVPGRGWRGAVPPSIPPTATAHHGRRTRRVGEDPRQRGGACRVVRHVAHGR